MYRVSLSISFLLRRQGDQHLKLLLERYTISQTKDAFCIRVCCLFLNTNETERDIVATHRKRRVAQTGFYVSPFSQWRKNIERFDETHLGSHFPCKSKDKN